MKEIYIDINIEKFSRHKIHPLCGRQSFVVASANASIEACVPIIPLNHTRIDICHRYIAIHLMYDVTISLPLITILLEIMCAQSDETMYSIYSRNMSNFSITSRMFFSNMLSLFHL